MSIQRFEFAAIDDWGNDIGACERLESDGDYVRYSDHQTELAELQATIARLTAENEAVKFNLDKTDKRYLAAVAEIERLKGWQGEPAAWANASDLSAIANGALWSGTLWGRKNHPIYEARRPLYTSQPAPVSVVLPSADDLRYLISRAARSADLISGANYYTAAELAAEALIDKVKELNQ